MSPRKERVLRPAPPAHVDPPAPTLNAAAVRLFVGHYLRNGLNATRAYLALHPNAKTTTAATEGWRLLRRDDVRDLVSSQLSSAWKQMDGDVAELVARLWLIARADPGDAYDEDGKLLAFHLWPESLRLAVEAYDDVEKTFRLGGRMTAIRTLLEQKKEIGGSNDLASLIAAARANGDQLRAQLGGTS